MLRIERGACSCARSFLPLRPPLRRTSRWRMSSSVHSTRQRRTRHHIIIIASIIIIISILRNSSSSSSGNGNGCRRLAVSGDFSRRTGRADRAAAWKLRFEGRRCFKAQRRWRFFLKWPLTFPDRRQYGNTDRNTRNTPRPRPKKRAFRSVFASRKIRKKTFLTPLASGQ